MAVKYKQIENKDSQIAQMQNLLDQQQRLALQDKNLLEEYKSEIKALKSLPIESQSDELEQNISQKNNDHKHKKWWPF